MHYAFWHDLWRFIDKFQKALHNGLQSNLCIYGLDFRIYSEIYLPASLYVNGDETKCPAGARFKGRLQHERGGNRQINAAHPSYLWVPIDREVFSFFLSSCCSGAELFVVFSFCLFLWLFNSVRARGREGGGGTDENKLSSQLSVFH